MGANGAVCTASKEILDSSVDGFAPVSPDTDTPFG